MLKKITPPIIISLVLAQLFLSPAISSDRSQVYAQRSGNGRQGRNLPTSEVPTDCDGEQLNSNNCRIISYLVTFINILGGLVGITVVGVIAFAGIQYSSARDNPQKVAVARERIVNALIALVAYMVMMGFLQWVIPGGVFR